MTAPTNEEIADIVEDLYELHEWLNRNRASDYAPNIAIKRAGDILQTLMREREWKPIVTALFPPGTIHSCYWCGESISDPEMEGLAGGAAMAVRDTSCPCRNIRVVHQFVGKSRGLQLIGSYLISADNPPPAPKEKA